MLAALVAACLGSAPGCATSIVWTEGKVLLFTVPGKKTVPFWRDARAGPERIRDAALRGGGLVVTVAYSDGGSTSHSFALDPTEAAAAAGSAARVDRWGRSAGLGPWRVALRQGGTGGGGTLALIQDGRALGSRSLPLRPVREFNPGWVRAVLFTPFAVAFDLMTLPFQGLLLLLVSP